MDIPWTTKLSSKEECAASNLHGCRHRYWRQRDSQLVSGQLQLSGDGAFLWQLHQDDGREEARLEKGHCAHDGQRGLSHVKYHDEVL